MATRKRPYATIRSVGFPVDRINRKNVPSVTVGSHYGDAERIMIEVGGYEPESRIPGQLILPRKVAERMAIQILKYLGETEYPR